MEKGPKIGRGRTAEVFGWKDNLILKLFFDSTPDAWAEQEARITRFAYEAGLPVAKVEGVVEIDGRNGILFQRIDGASMLTESKSKPWKLFRSARVLAELHAAMHECVSLIFRLGEPPPGTRGRWLINAGRGLYHSTYLKRYLGLSPASNQEIDAWRLPVAAARLRENIPAEKSQLLRIIETSLLTKPEPDGA